MGFRALSQYCTSKTGMQKDSAVSSDEIATACHRSFKIKLSLSSVLPLYEINWKELTALFNNTDQADVLTSGTDCV